MLETPLASCDVKVRLVRPVVFLCSCQSCYGGTWDRGAPGHERRCRLYVMIFQLIQQEVVLRSLSRVFTQLLSLGGRSAVGIRQVVVGLRFRPGAEFQPGLDAGIDLHRVQAMMEEMGTTLSPGAQNLMEMVQFQQKVSTRGRARHLFSDVHEGSPSVCSQRLNQTNVLFT